MNADGGGDVTLTTLATVNSQEEEEEGAEVTCSQ